jgi:hypothetical protein
MRDDGNECGNADIASTKSNQCQTTGAGEKNNWSRQKETSVPIKDDSSVEADSLYLE